MIPQQLLTCRETIRLALERIRREEVETCWSDAGCLLPPEWAYCGDAGYAGGTIKECAYRTRLKATPEQIWEPIARIGGKTGWYFGESLWRLRGGFDRLIGGIGLRRGRRDASRLQVGDALDFWRVIEIETNHHLALLAEMKLPGDGLLQFEVEPAGSGITDLVLISRFFPRGLAGLAYWNATWPIHKYVFSGMSRSLAKSARAKIINGPERFTPETPYACSMPK